MLDFLFAFFLEISEIFESSYLWTKTDINKGLKPSSQFSSSFISANKNIIKRFDILTI